MTSNSPNMTLEEKVVQHIKSTSLMLLVNDEDALTDLARRAVKEALYQPRTVNDGSYHTKTVDSPAVECAREVATAAYKKIMQDEVDKMMADPETIKTLRSAMMLMLPRVLEETIRGVYQSLVVDSSNQGLQMLREGGYIK